jgi:hypothetical protein
LLKIGNFSRLNRTRGEYVQFFAHSLQGSIKSKNRLKRINRFLFSTGLVSGFNEAQFTKASGESNRHLLSPDNALKAGIG